MFVNLRLVFLVDLLNQCAILIHNRLHLAEVHCEGTPDIAVAFLWKFLCISVIFMFVEAIRTQISGSAGRAIVIGSGNGGEGISFGYRLEVSVVVAVGVLLPSPLFERIREGFQSLTDATGEINNR
ncbi:hypothetical protein U1Q18_045588, partial [Sarracenia purpurea var. burkii]